MKEKKDKKGKQLESTIGKIIYGFLLFAPLLVCLTTSMYAIFNKNAYKSYYGETINQEIIKPAEQFRLNKTYTTTYTTTTTIELQTNNYVYVKNLKFLNGTNNTNLNNLLQHQENIYRFRYTYNQANINIQFQYMNENNINSDLYYSIITNYTTTPTNYGISFEYEISEITTGTFTQILPYTTYTEYNKYSYLDNSYEYGLYKAENSTLFNWSKNTAIYTILSTTCVGLGITNTFTPFLMAYWLLISVIYFIYDIGLMLIMVMHRKIHEMQEGI